ncbi:hypothetical protein D049_2445B, partial [Vibrio parahaemolyticus VPTS-2010]
SV